VSRFVTDVLNDDPLLTPAEVAALFRVDRKTVSRWAKAGLLPSMKTPGGRVRFRRSAVTPLLTS
jgi:excisionase family DNA binding protein